MDCYEEIKRYFYKVTGIRFDSKIDIVNEKIERAIRLLGYDECSSFIHDVKNDSDVLQKLIDLLTVSMSYFYREIEHFEFIEKELCAKQNKIFSIPCAMGEEPYSLAIYLLEHGKAEFFIDASDISAQAIQEANEGCYLHTKFRYMPEKLFKKYFRQKGNRFCIDEQIKKYISFSVKNLFNLERESSKYDFILCRNLFIYFDQKKKLEALQILSERLLTGGYLIVGKADHIDKDIANLKKIGYKHLKIFRKEA
ncbi:CheR family methyltransferase [Nitratiruptor sp. SB155-2]|uniref:CheR family methyltransferase n=1 Tax=Nitratiruptor sp. (strain SB155-2) TaxID=387092 RepID=UPI00015873DC|nr:CheR family methyltransferase [Nitratiruptor sp. SB155-2]BAF69900.1 chemotaxis protein methyltransferase [Nitratiruptor sp. SB155-2]